MNKLIASLMLTSLMAACDDQGPETTPDVGPMVQMPEPTQVWVAYRDTLPDVCLDAPLPEWYVFTDEDSGGSMLAVVALKGDICVNVHWAAWSPNRWIWTGSKAVGDWQLRTQSWEIMSPNKMCGYTQIDRGSDSCRVYTCIIVEN